MLVGYGFVANQQAWQCDIDSSHQIEYLKYNEEGRYKAHLDCYPTEPMKISRKLTVLAFLNDDFEGGKFYLQTSESLIYPEQSKGSVIVIPSYLLHGVEDITQGIRHSLVCWINGPSYR
jgi:PKHD-type hydroxylase